MSNVEYREIKVPPLGESVSEATVSRWLKNKGESIKADEIIVELETDKVTLEVTSPASGIVQDIHVNSGETVHVGSILGTVNLSGKSSEETAKTQKKPENFTPPEQKTELEVKPPLKPEQPIQYINSDNLAPSVRKIVEEKHLDPQTISATGKDGRLTKEDVLVHLGESSKTSQNHLSSDNTTVAPRQSHQREERVKISRLRQRIAERLKHAQNTAAILTTFNEVDMSAINDFRAKYKESFEKKHGSKLGFMSFFVKASIQALKEIPAVNAEIHGDEIIYKNYYDIGVAVSAPTGLVVPVVRQADALSFAEVEKNIVDLGQRARDGKLTMEDMSGGTFTISNGGIFGSLMSTPILNPPQTGILGMHKIQDRVVVINGKMEIRPMMYIALSYDHRLIDGREAVTFLVRVKENIENPERLLLEV